MKSRLSTQIILLNLMMIAIFALAISGSLAYLIKTDIQEINDEWGDSFTASLGESIATATINGNVVQARQNILEVLRRSKSIEYIYVTDFENRLFVHSFDTGMPKQILNKIQKYRNAILSLTDGSTRHVELTLGGIDIKEYRYPLIEGLSASVFIGINANDTSQVIFNTLTDIALITLIVMLISILVSLLLSRRIVKPLEIFNKRMIDYGQTGKLNADQQTDFHHIEIKQLNDSFNQLVSERNKAESKLKKTATQLNQFKSTLDNTNDCVFMFTADTLKFTYCNDGAMKQVGYGPDEIASMKPFDIKPEFSEAQFRDLITQMKNDGNDFISFETIHQHKDGHTLPVEIGMQYMHPKNEAPHFLAIVRDITERKTAENKLRKYQHQLEELVDERTQELRSTQDELVRKERLATLGNLTATVSHELRNPLGSMRPSLYVIETVTRDSNNEKLQSAVQRLYRSIDRCDRIIDELLDFTRITELSIQNITLDDWLSEVIHEQPLLNGIELVYQPHLDNTQVNIDADRFRRAIINIFENACHAMLITDSTTEVIDNAKLSIRTQTSNDRVNILISDSGDGIPDEVMEKIFEPLFSTKGFGIGLGMPTVKQIMEQHKGGIDIDTSSKGTTVTLWLPLPYRIEIIE